MNQNEDNSVDTTQYNKRLMGNVVRLPLEVGAADGSTIHTSEGSLHDFWGDEGVQSLGYGAAPNAAMEKFITTGAPHQLPDVYPHQLRWDAAELICSMTGMDRIFFCNSGTEANEAMIKLARKYWWDLEGQPMNSPDLASTARRHRVLTLDGNFHGRTGLALAASDPRVSPYHRWGFGPVAQGFGVIHYNPFEEEFFEVVTDGLESGPRQVDWRRVAAITMAPVLGNNCVTTYPREFWAALDKVRKDHGVLIMYDDVQAGNGRAGYPATWQHPDCQVKPDIMCLGKGMALGFPAAAMLASEEITRSFTPGVHFNTFGGSPFVCFMMVHYYRWLEENLSHVRELGDRIRGEFAKRHWIKHHDGSGLLNAFTPDFEKFGYDGYEFCHAAREFGLSIVTHRQFGPIRFTPPMNVADSVVVQALDALDHTHNRLSEQISRVMVMDAPMFLVDRRPDRNERARIRDNAPHSHYALGREDIATELDAFDRVCRAMRGRGDKPKTVLELFGGSGWHSLLIQRHVRPDVHDAWDASKDCVDSIRKSLPDVAAVNVDDSLALLAGTRHYDWIHADFNLLNVEMVEQEIGPQIHALFSAARAFVTITDTTPSDISSDPMALATYLEKQIVGWTRIATYRWGPAQMHVFHSGQASEGFVPGFFECDAQAEIELQQ